MKSGEKGGKVIYSSAQEDISYIRKNIPCQAACPAGTNIPGYIRALFEEHHERSYRINREVNILPGVLGRICSRPCEDSCRHGERGLGDPVNICHIKRAAADLRSGGDGREATPAPSLGLRAAVIGSGPAGLAAAHDLACAGAEVTVYEALDLPGGMLRYGIPEFRLPREVLDAEIDHIAGLGVTFRTGRRLGADLAAEQLLEQYDAVLLAAGCYRSNRLGAAGEDLNGVVSGLEFMMDVSAGRSPKVGETVLVIGDGFTAFDCARTSLRLGAKDVRICSRLTREDLVVTKDEVVEAEREGVRFEFLLTATRIKGEMSVTGVEFLRTRLGDTGADGRREAAPIEGSEFTIPADTVIAAIGQRPEPLSVPGEQGDGPVAADAETYRAAARGLYVAGDYLTGPSTVIEAVAMGRRAAWKIVGDHEGGAPRRQAVRIEETEITDRERTWDFLPRQEMPSLPVEERLASGEKEVEQGFGRETAKIESQRCYLCYLHYEIDMERCIYCRYCIDVAPRDCIKLVREVRLNDDGSVAELVETESWHDVNAVVIDNERCIRCGACMRVCPVECISVSKVEMVERREDPRHG